MQQIAAMMLHVLTSSLHHESTPLPCPNDCTWAEDDQVLAIMTGGTEAQFVQLLREGRITLDKNIFLMVSGQSNSLAAGMEILSYINQHGGHGQIRINR